MELIVSRFKKSDLWMIDVLKFQINFKIRFIGAKTVYEKDWWRKESHPRSYHCDLFIFYCTTYHPNSLGCSDCLLQPVRKSRIPVRSRRTPDFPCRRIVFLGRSTRSSPAGFRKVRSCKTKSKISISSVLRQQVIITMIVRHWPARAIFKGV